MLAMFTSTFLILSVFLCGIKACSVSMDLVIAIDASGSVGYSGFKSCLEFAKDIVGAFDTDTGIVRVGMMTFDHTTRIIFHLNTNMRNLDMKMAITNAAYTSGLTDIKLALEEIIVKMFVEEKGDRRNVRNAVFLVTDGKSYPDPVPAAEAAHSQGITIYVLGVGSGTSHAQLEGMASKPTSDHLFQKSSFDDFSEYGGIVTGQICQVQAAKDPPSCSMEETFKFSLKREYILPFERSTLITNVRLLADCIWLCIDHFKDFSKCEAINFCKPYGELGGTCQMGFLMNKWEKKFVANSTCVFGTSLPIDI